MVPTCFVIQPFDRGRYDKLYDDVFADAIQEAGMQPYRVDRDPEAERLIEDIESGIRKADACFAEISEDNPNVWYELGYAVAKGKPVVLVCSENRPTDFPFDVRHRHIITYTSEAPRDFANLKEEIATRLRAQYNKRRELTAVADLSPAAPKRGLTEHELVALISIAQNQDTPDITVWTTTIRQEMNRAGFTEIATTLALRGLVQKELIEYTDVQDERGEQYMVYKTTEKGMQWLETNQEQLVLKRRPSDDALPF